MLFRKKIEKSCLYCALGAKLAGDVILCTKRGITVPRSKCRKFRYDPCKRVPPRPKQPDFDRFSAEDFSL